MPEFIVLQLICFCHVDLSIFGINYLKYSLRDGKGL